MRKKTTTIDIYLADRKKIEDLKYLVKEEFDKDLKNPEALKLVLGFIDEKEKDFKEYLKKELYSQGNSS